MGKKRIEKENAFFSVEAALVMPLVMAAMLLAVSLFVFQYDRCLMEQDMAAQALKAASAGARDKEELTEKVRMQAAELYRNKYVAWDMVVMDVKMKKGMVEALGEGRFRFPLPEWNFWNRENTWHVRAECKARRTSPVTFIRNYRKTIQGGN